MTKFDEFKVWVKQAMATTKSELDAKFFAFDVNVNYGTYDEKGGVDKINFWDRCRVSEFTATMLNDIIETAQIAKCTWIDIELCAECRNSFQEDWEMIEDARDSFSIELK